MDDEAGPAALAAAARELAGCYPADRPWAAPAATLTVVSVLANEPVNELAKEK
ncbi:hypothetical protein [Streptomyces celluloflavus]|uniref:hypothetical protein n=1 Tax=Streptomyces celluloflavus TaxID=58344 RepID=UPI0036A40155